MERKICDRCCGNGEIVIDWDRYLKPLDGDIGDEAVRECSDCDGYGFVDDMGEGCEQTQTAKSD